MLPFLTILSVLLAIALVILSVRYRAIARTREAHEQRRQDKHDEAHRDLESERFTILDALSDPIFLVDAEGIVRFVNTLGCDLFRNREFLGRPMAEVFLDDRLSEPIRESLTNQSQVTAEVILPLLASPLGDLDRRSETAWLVDAGPIHFEGSPHLTRVIIRDATAEHQTEQVRKDFVANASHELRTPLAIINGYLENLLDDDVINDPDAARRFLTIMQKHGKRIARIVEDMLVISRLESGEAGNLKMKPFNLEACVQDVLERLESVINTQGAHLRVRSEDRDLVLIGDRFYWTQVLFNLVENALKQNPETPLEVEIGWKKAKDNTLRMWVTDNGVGIPSGDLPFIFRRFYRVEKHHSQIEIKGTGLGLSIVKRAVEAHGGQIQVTSIPGDDTRFEITLPAGAIALNEVPSEPEAADSSELADPKAV